jgi:hypothetical protein
MLPQEHRPTLRSGERGLTLVEAAASISVFTIIALVVGLSLVRGMEHERQSFEYYQALAALRDFIADVQETANLDTNLSAQEGIGSIYAKYNAKTFTISTLSGGQIAVTCYPNEATVPSALGGVQDLNFDGDAADNHGGAAAGSDLLLVPMTFTLTYNGVSGSQTIVLNRLVTQTTD